MTTPNTDLAEQIMNTLAKADGRERASTWDHYLTRSVLPHVDAAVKRGQAEALRKVALHLNDSGDEAFVMQAADLIEEETP